MSKKYKSGISLIVLVITIIVIIILAGAIILSLSANNPISSANKATFLSDVSNFKTELSLYETKQFTDNMGLYNPTSLQADGASITYNNTVNGNETIYDLIPSLGKVTKYAGQFEVENGELVFGGTDTKQREWATESGIKVIIIGEPKVTINAPAITAVMPGTDIVYTIKFSSNVTITAIDLIGKIEVLDNAGVALPSQPDISIGAINGVGTNTTIEVDVTITTINLLYGSYKLKIKPESVTNINDLYNTIDTISLIGFDITDNVPPTNPTILASTADWTNGDVTVTVTYSEDTQTKEYSLDGTTWNSYTVLVVVTNNITVYAKGKDLAGNESGQSTLTIANIDKFLPTVVCGTDGGIFSTQASTIVTVSDTGGSETNNSTLQYIWDTQNTITPNSGWTSFTNDSIITSPNGLKGAYYLWIKASDNAGNLTVVTTNIFNLNYWLAFSQKYYSPIDFQTLQQADVQSNISMNSQQLDAKISIQNADEDNYFKYVSQDQDGNWTSIGYLNSQISNSYYFDKFMAVNNTYYTNPGFPGISDGEFLYSSTFPIQVYSGYSFDSTTGVYKTDATTGTLGSITRYSPIGATYYKAPQPSKLYKYVKTSNSSTNANNYYVQFNYVYSTAVISYLKGSYVNTLLAYNTDYPVNGGYTDNYWYERKNLGSQYTLYKYEYPSLEFKSKYDIVNKQLTSAPIMLNQVDDGVKVLIDTASTVYKLYISIDNINWTEVSDKSKLDGNNIITLPLSSSVVYLRIDNIDSIINKIEVRERNY